MAEIPIWIIDREHWPRAYLVAELTGRGYDVRGFIDIEEALAELRHGRDKWPSIIMLELRNQRITDAILGSLRHTGILVIGIGGATELGQESVSSFAWAKLLKRPITIGLIADTIEELIKRG